MVVNEVRPVKRSPRNSWCDVALSIALALVPSAAARATSPGSRRCRRPSGIAAYSAEVLPLLRRALERSTSSPSPPQRSRRRVQRARLRVEASAPALRPDGLPAGQRRVPRLHVGLPLPLSGPGRPARRAGASGARAGAAQRWQPRATTTWPSFAPTIPTRRPTSATGGRRRPRRAAVPHWPHVRLVLEGARLARRAQPRGCCADCAADTRGGGRRRADGRRGSDPPPAIAGGRLRCAPAADSGDAIVRRGVRRRDAGEAPRPLLSTPRRARRPSIHACTCCSSAPRPSLRRRGRRHAAGRIADRVHVTGYVRRRGAAPGICRRPTSAPVCAGRPTARRRRRGCAASPPGERRWSPTLPISVDVPTLDPRGWRCSTRRRLRAHRSPSASTSSTKTARCGWRSIGSPRTNAPAAARQIRTRLVGSASSARDMADDYIASWPRGVVPAPRIDLPAHLAETTARRPGRRRADGRGARLAGLSRLSHAGPRVLVRAPDSVRWCSPCRCSCSPCR